MTTKTFKGKAIYNPSGKASEYAKWACNFYVGCSNGCTYCYLKKGRGATILGGNAPKLKSCFKSEEQALEIFEKELKSNLPELQEHGLFFSFTTDPMLCTQKECHLYIPDKKGFRDVFYSDGTIELTWTAVTLCVDNDVPVKILTKNTCWVDRLLSYPYPLRGKKIMAFGFTLTGHDELEPNASTNAERIAAMKKLHDAGFKTFASIEPIIDLDNSIRMFWQTNGFCDLYKIGLMSGEKYDKPELRNFIEAIICTNNKGKFYNIYFKDSLLKAAGINREELPSNCVNRDYNIFKK